MDFSDIQNDPDMMSALRRTGLPQYNFGEGPKPTTYDWLDQIAHAMTTGGHGGAGTLVGTSPNLVSRMATRPGWEKGLAWLKKTKTPVQVMEEDPKLTHPAYGTRDVMANTTPASQAMAEAVESAVRAPGAQAVSPLAKYVIRIRPDLFYPSTVHQPQRAAAALWHEGAGHIGSAERSGTSWYNPRLGDNLSRRGFESFSPLVRGLEKDYSHAAIEFAARLSAGDPQATSVFRQLMSTLAP